MARSRQRRIFKGGSTGGREALAAIQRWPADWNGAIALYPAWNDMGALLSATRHTRALAAPGAYPNQAKRKVIYDAAMAACDALDGVADGLISNQTECNAIFDPKVVRCAGGADTGDTCLSDAQIKPEHLTTRPARLQLPPGEWIAVIPRLQRMGCRSRHGPRRTREYALQPTVTFLALGNGAAVMAHARQPHAVSQSVSGPVPEIRRDA